MARRATYRWQGWAVDTRTNAEVERFRAEQDRRRAAQAARRREELGLAAAPVIAQTLPPHTGWLTLDDVCVMSGAPFEEVDAGCDVLASEGLVRRALVFVEAVGAEVDAVRRTDRGTLEAEPLRAWLERVMALRFDDDVAETAECLEISEAFLRRLLEDSCDRVLLEAADWLFVRAGEPHQLALLYPDSENASALPDGA